MSDIETRSCTIRGVFINLPEFGKIIFDFHYSETYYASNGREDFERKISKIAVRKTDDPQLTGEEIEKLRLALNKVISEFADVSWEEAFITDEDVISGVLDDLGLITYPDDEEDE
jgi:hypothetical protein